MTKLLGLNKRSPVVLLSLTVFLTYQCLEGWRTVSDHVVPSFDEITAGATKQDRSARQSTDVPSGRPAILVDTSTQHHLPSDLVVSSSPDLVLASASENKSTSNTAPSDHCTRAQIRNGVWQPAEYPRPPYISRTTHLQCEPVSEARKHPWKTWEWTPTDDSCLLTSWNSSDLCSLLTYSCVSVIGDSLSWEMYSSLLQLLGEPVVQKNQHRSKNYDVNHLQMSCGLKTKFVFRNDPRLHRVADSIENDFPTVLVLNRGAYYEPDDDLLSDMKVVIEVIKEWNLKCEAVGIKCHLFWRTTVPGHPQCANFTEPVNDILEMERHIGNLALYDNKTIEYHWQDYQRQNVLALDFLEKSGVDYEVIDAYDLNILRPDGHRINTGDCLHNCYPGKMDVYNQLLLHFLKIQRSLADSSRMEELFWKAYNSRFSNSTEQAGDNGTIGSTTGDD